ncbi:MAG: hypothetical protein ACR2NX_05905 [Chthoniobacterales bacterium]
MRTPWKCLIALLSLALAWPIAATQIVGTPEISIAGSQATARWQTDVACGTRAKVEPSATVSTPVDRTPTTDHVVTIRDLKPGVAYRLSLGTARHWLLTRDLAANRTESPLSSIKPASPAAAPQPSTSPPPARQTWGHPSSLPDHFARHGADVGARNPDDYARRAWEFLQRAKRDGLPAKVDRDGVLRVFDPASGAFAAYNRDGTTKTFFKPGSRDYFARQPGRDIDLRTWK